nr:MAG TPA: hypothetical protein [Caudoviricetes sp.]
MGVYNIGTKDGYDISESLKNHQGTSTTVKDGSTWTADKSGNIWVTKDGVTTKANITYKPGGSGGSVSGGGGGSGVGTGTSGGTAAQPKDWSTPGGSGSSSTVDSAADKRAAYDQQIQDYIRQLQQMQGQKTATAADQSDYIRQMYEQQLAANKAQLESDYNQNVSNLDSEASKIGSNYYEQRRQTQANADRAQANYNEMANASGLNSGTGSQAQLARSNQLQSDLTTLGNAEAQNRAEIERQRTLLGQQYQNAIQKAQAENNMELAQKLYQEAARVDESIIDASKNDSSRALEILNMMLSQVSSERNLASEDARQAAEIAAASGKYGLYGKLYGLSDDVIKRLEEIYNKELADKEAERRLDLALKAKQAGRYSSDISISEILKGLYS